MSYNSTFIVQGIAVVSFAACLLHSWNTEGRRAAQQWFLIGYIFVLLLINLLVVTQQIAYSDSMLVIGAAPSLTIMLLPALFYLAYTVAKFFAEPTDLTAMAYLIFVFTPALMLPLDATAQYLHWWSFPSESFFFLNGIPFYLPFAWGLVAAAFFLMVGRIRKIRFRGSGQFFAMIIAAPVLAGITLLLVALVQVLIDSLAVLGGSTALYLALALLFFGLPVALIFNIPRITRPSRETN